MEIFQNHPLAPYTTIKIGGPADTFIITHSTEEFIDALKNNQDITILGNGSNVLISDSGIRGTVIKNSSQNIDIIDTSPIPINFNHTYTQRKENEPDKFLDFSKVDYDESLEPQVLVKISSGTPLPYAINYLFGQGITGLQWFAYIPGTIGGAVFQNIHGGTYHISDYLESIEVYNLENKQFENYLKKDLEWKYEKSFFQKHPNLVIISATLRLFKGNIKLARQVFSAWIIQKTKVQPTNSAGSVFANPSVEQCQKIWGEQKSAGWIIDHELNWKEKQLGGAQISPQHSNFIINTGNATAKDVSGLVTEIKNEVQKRFNFTLHTEIKFLGLF
ncbi:MAG TPA: FAD-binding protein [Candidatus Methanoperedens sp.]|nr:FAD-binding protein [Candidatus Methanoperedens sp.]